MEGPMITSDADAGDLSGGQGLSLDPFSFFPDAASRVGGLGGAGACQDPTYVFHTPYVQASPGPITFTIRFTGLMAKRGTLLLRVNMLPTEPGAHARLVNSERITLNRLAAEGSQVTISAEGFRGFSYAVFGSIADDTDAVAERLEVLLDRPDDGSDHGAAVADARNTLFGTETLKPTGRLVSLERATLAEPVSQMCTAAQFDEPVYAEWLERLQMPLQRHRKQWEFIYILQVLRRYGMLAPGARGVGFGVGTEPLPAVMASFGATVVATDLPSESEQSAVWSATGQHGSAIDSLRFPGLCDPATFDAAVSFRPVDMTAIPADLVNFDFTWSSCAYEHLGSIAAGLKFVQDSLNCLRPGGLAVHTSEFNLTSNDETVETGGTVLFRRSDMERLALTLISRGHEVAQIKLDSGDTPLDQHVDMPPYLNDPHLKMALGRFATTSFGIIVRKARSPI